jgi:hypothetical protein
MRRIAMRPRRLPKEAEYEAENLEGKMTIVRSMVIVGGFLLLGAAVLAQPWPWPESMDAVWAAPQNHKVLYEDDNVRIMEVTVKSREIQSMHHHRWPSVLMIDSYPKHNNHLIDGRVIPEERPAADRPFPLVVSRGPTPPHAVENLDTIPFHLYSVEFKKIEFRN